jgi:prepilin-type N-terminal cleavage/methylation domain-containing protein
MKRFMKKLFNPLRKKTAAHNKGFTLLEILVVLTIMGFLIAMVAPRLAGISGSAVDTVCDTNQNRMVGYMAAYFEKTSRYPTNLTNLILEDTTANTYQIPRVSDEDPENGPETLASEFYDRNHFHLHLLDANEAAELKNMGVANVFNLNDFSGQNDAGTAFEGGADPDVANVLVAAADRGASMRRVPVAAGVGVAMIGCGVDASTNFVATNATERGWGEPDWFGRIILGMGPESGLIKSGIIGNAAHCPGGIQNADNVTYNDYNLVLPRLEATALRMQDAVVGAAILAMDNDAVEDGVQLNAVAYDSEPSADYDYATNADHYRSRTFTIDEAQESWQYATQCPEGHSYPEDDGEFWGIDLNHNAHING